MFLLNNMNYCTFVMPYISLEIKTIMILGLPYSVTLTLLFSLSPLTLFIFFFLLNHISEQVVPSLNCDFALPPILKVKKSHMLNPTY